MRSNEMQNNYFQRSKDKIFLLKIRYPNTFQIKKKTSVGLWFYSLEIMISLNPSENIGENNS